MNDGVNLGFRRNKTDNQDDAKYSTLHHAQTSTAPAKFLSNSASNSEMILSLTPTIENMYTR